MKKHLLGIFILTLWTSSAPAQDTSSDVPSLADIIGNMNASELAILENSIGPDSALSADFDITIDNIVAEAIEEGVISADEATDASATLALVSSNAEYFNFDILDVIGSVIEQGTYSISKVRNTLEGFNTLSDTGKQIVGRQDFDYISAVVTYDPIEVANDTDEGRHMAASMAIWNQLSEADKAIVINQMPILSEQAP